MSIRTSAALGATQSRTLCGDARAQVPSRVEEGCRM